MGSAAATVRDPQQREQQISAAGLQLLGFSQRDKDLYDVIAGLGLWYPAESLLDTRRAWSDESPRAEGYVRKRYCRFAFEASPYSDLWHAFGDVPLHVAWEIFGGEGLTEGNGATLPWPSHLESHLRPYIGQHDEHGACYQKFEIEGQQALEHFVRILKKYELDQVKRMFTLPQ